MSARVHHRSTKKYDTRTKNHKHENKNELDIALDLKVTNLKGRAIYAMNGADDSFNSGVPNNNINSNLTHNYTLSTMNVGTSSHFPQLIQQNVSFAQTKSRHASSHASLDGVTLTNQGSR